MCVPVFSEVEDILEENLENVQELVAWHLLVAQEELNEENEASSSDSSSHGSSSSVDSNSSENGSEDVESMASEDLVDSPESEDDEVVSASVDSDTDEHAVEYVKIQNVFKGDESDDKGLEDMTYNVDQRENCGSQSDASSRSENTTSIEDFKQTNDSSTSGLPYESHPHSIKEPKTCSVPPPLSDEPTVNTSKQQILTRKRHASPSEHQRNVNKKIKDNKDKTLAKEKADKKKEMFTAKQIETLESKYKVEKHPSAVTLKCLASEFEYPISLVERWFRLRREKDEKDSKNGVDTVPLPSESEVPVLNVSDSVASSNKAETTMIVFDKEEEDDIKITPETVQRSRSSTPRSTASRSSIKDHVTPSMTRSSQEDLKKEQDIKVESSEHSRSSTPRSTASRASTRDSSKETPQSSKSVNNLVEDSPKTVSPIKRRVLQEAETTEVGKTVPYVCQECNSVFFNLTHLREHMTVVHEGIKKHECTTCHEKFSKEFNLQLHMKIKHPDILK